MSARRKASARRTGYSRFVKDRRVQAGVIGLCALAVIASALTVVAGNGDLDVAGEAIDVSATEVTPGKRPDQVEGVKLDAPPKSEQSSYEMDFTESREAAPAKPKTTCDDASKRSALLDLSAGDDLCVDGATGQADPETSKPLNIDPGTPVEPEPVPEDVTPVPDEPTPPVPGDDPTPSPEPESPQSSAGPASSSAAELRQLFTPAVLRLPEVRPSGTAGEHLAPNWTLAAGVETPPNFSNAASMVFDAERKVTVLFGGRDSTGAVGAETWIWNGQAWTQAAPAASPPARYRASMAWDPIRKQVVLFGGQTSTGYLNDVWTWDGSTWTKVTPAGSGTNVPTARAGSAMAWDPGRAALVVFGGSTGASTTVNDTYQLKSIASPASVTWTRLNAGGSGTSFPSVRADSVMAYSAATQTPSPTSHMVLFGGASTGNCPSSCAVASADTWTMPSTSTTWTKVSTPSPNPPARTQAAMVYDPGLGAPVMFGGLSVSGTTGTTLGDTWAWTGSRWSKAVGGSSPSGRAQMAMSADDKGAVTFFGGVGYSSLDETWVYDSRVPLLTVSLKDQDDQAITSTVWTGQTVKVAVEAVNTRPTPIEPSMRVSIASALSGDLLAGGSVLKLDSQVLTPCGSIAELCGAVNGLTAQVSNIAIPSTDTNFSRTFSFVANVAGSQRGCELISVPAVASVVGGAASNVADPAQVPACGGGLGIEKWWTYDTTDLGNGNLVVKQVDSTPVQTRGRLALAVGRAYNSQDKMSGGGPLGAGWQFDIGDTGETAGTFGIAGLKLPNLQSLSQPLSKPYIDRDGTRHLFKLRALNSTVGGTSLPIDLNDPGSSIAKLIDLENLPQTWLSIVSDLELNLCIDQAYEGPPGTNMSLFRYVAAGSANACSNPNGDNDQIIGWSLVRSDRVRYDFNVLGDLVSVTDPAGQQLIYGYTPGVQYGPTSISPQSCPKSNATCPKITIDYDAGGTDSPATKRRVEVVDSAKRVTSYVVSKDGALPLLLETWDPGNPYSTGPNAAPSQKFTYATADAGCEGSTGTRTPGQMCSVSDATGAVTKFAYEDSSDLGDSDPRGPQRVKTVTDRRGTVAADGAEKGLKTRYSYQDQPRLVVADTGKPSIAQCDSNAACQRKRYSTIDAYGRIGVVEEGLANNTYTGQTGYMWDYSLQTFTCSAGKSLTLNHNLCQTIKRAVPSNESFRAGRVGTATVNGVTVQDEGVAYLYGRHGQVIRRNVLQDASKPWNWSGGTDPNDNSAITTFGSLDQYFTAAGDRRSVTTSVAGKGLVYYGPSAANYRSKVMTDKPLDYWRLGESGADPVIKSETGRNNGVYNLQQCGAGQGRPGISPGNTAFGDCSANWGLTWANPTGQPSGTTAAGSDFTVEAWSRPKSVDGQQVVYQWGNSGNRYATVGRYLGKPYVNLYGDNGAGKYLSVVTPVSLDLDEWSHVAYAYDGSGLASGVKIYIDGLEYSTDAEDSTKRLVVVKDSLGGEPYADGSGIVALAGYSSDSAPSTLDEVAIYDKQLSSTRIGRHFLDALEVDLGVAAPDVLYSVTDQLQELSPRGNTAANWGDYVTTMRRDVPKTEDTRSTNRPVEGNKICGDAARGNTGLLCEVGTPASDGVDPGSCTSPTSSLAPGAAVGPTSSSYAYSCATYEYNGAGQKTKMRTPKANAEGGDAYAYDYYDEVKAGACSGDNVANCDLSGTVSAGGWLKSVTDPAGKMIAYAYDAAGNTARTWDRNATAGKSGDATWANASAPPSNDFSESVSATPVTSDAFGVSYAGIAAITADGRVVGAGANSQGELGDGTNTARSGVVPVEDLTNVVQISQSSTGSPYCSFTLHLRGNGEVWQTGYGQSTATKVAVPSNIVSVSAGGCHSLALDVNGDLWAFGVNTSGQVGNGSTSDYSPPTKVLSGVATVGPGFLHSLAVKTDGTVWAWGNNGSGQLGLGNTDNKNSPTQVPNLSGIRAVSAGYGSSYAVRRDGTVFAWGRNSNGELGNGSTTSSNTPVKVPSLGPGTSAGMVKQVVGGAYTAAALMADGKVRTWGVNNYGQLGGGTTDESVSTPREVPNVTRQVAIAGGWATWATADAAGDLTVWGYTASSQLANGTNPTVSEPTKAGLDVSPYRTPWRYERGSRNAVGDTTTSYVDPIGRARVVRPGRGHAVFSSMFDVGREYDAVGRTTRVMTAQNRGGAKASLTEYDPFGNPVKSVDARGNATRTDYDADNRAVAVKVTRGTDNVPVACTATASTTDWTSQQSGHKICTTSTTYDGNDRPITATDANGQVSRTTYDAVGRQTKVGVTRSTSTTVTSGWRYDLDGNVLAECSPRQFAAGATSCTGGPDQQFSSTSTFDRAGLATKVTQYRGSSALETSTAYDADQNPVRITDANGNTTSSTYDLQQRRLTATEPRTDGVTNSTRWTYDATGNVSSVRAPGSLNTGSGRSGDLEVDGMTASGSTDGAAHGASNPFKVPDGAQYRNVTLKNGAYLTAEAASGLMLHATAKVTVCSTCVVDMTGRGRAGGAGGTGGLGGNPGGPKAADEPPANSGIGGAGNGIGNGSGGGGGGHKTAGETGRGGAGGAGGAKSGTSDFFDVGTDYLAGSGGGGGGGGQGLVGSGGGDGGDGGGYIRVTATSLEVAPGGVITASGETGASGTGGNGAGGGGGAGGGIWLGAKIIVLGSTDVLRVDGGAGGKDAPDGSTDRAGGAGSTGFIRLDADTVTNEPAGVDRSRAARIMAYSYDPANQLIDSVDGAQSFEADPTKDSSSFAVPDRNGLANTRSRNVYDAEGRVISVLPPTAFSDAASLNAPNVNVAQRYDFDLDGRQVAAYSPRFNDQVVPIFSGSAGDGGKGVNQQATQCTTNRIVDAAPGTKPYSASTGVCVTRTEFDAIGNTSRQWLPTSNGSDTRRLDYQYTPDNLPALVRGPDPTGSGQIDVSKTKFDGVGRSLEITDANGQTAALSYTADGLLASAQAPSYTIDGTTVLTKTSYGYDADGNQTSVTTGKPGQTGTGGTTVTTTNEFDSVGALVSTTAPGDRTTTYQYDKVGNITSTKLPQQQTSGKATINEFTADDLLAATHTPIDSNTYRSVRYAYAPSGLRISTETAKCESSSTTACVPGNAAWKSAGTMRLTYGANGRMADEIGREKKSVTTGYDQNGEPQQIDDPTTNIKIEANYYLDGSLRSVNDGRLSTLYAYDASGQMTVRADKTPASGVTGNTNAITSYSNNQAGLASTMLSSVLGKSTDYEYDKAGRVLRASTDGHVNEWNWHPDGQLAGAKTTAGGKTIGQYVYRYDNAGDLTKRTATSGDGGPQYTDTFGYNDARNTTNWTRGPAPGETGTPATTNYTWDKNSNRLTEGARSWTYRQDNSIATEATPGQNTRTYSYDNAGRLTSDGCNTNTYDDFDRLAKSVVSGTVACGDDSRTVEYEYDGLDRQRESKVSGSSKSGANVTTKSVFDAMTTTVVGQVDATNGANSSPDVLYQLDADGTPVATKQSGDGAGTYFLDTDGMGSVTNVVGTSDTRTCSTSYDPFGNPQGAPASGATGVCASGSNAGSTGNTLWYRGQTRDASTGDYQMGGRTYDPKTGAFSTPDTYRAGDSDTNLSVGTDPLTANTYSYVNGDPINMIDPSGHYPSCGSAACDRPPVSKALQPKVQAQIAKSVKAEKAAWARAKDPQTRATALKRQEAQLTKQANAEFDWRKQIVRLVGDVTGINDIIACVTKGSVGACLSTFAGLAGAAVWKSGKFIKGGLKLFKAFDNFNDSRRAARAALDEVKLARKKLADEISSFKKSRSSTKSTDKGGEFCSIGARSFSGKTLVLMADGSRKPIGKIRAGDRVMATDPMTGKQSGQAVTKVWVHADDLTNLKLGNGEVLTTTEDHPFWNATDLQWEEIQDFDAGDVVVTDEWLPVEVTGLDPGSTYRDLAYNLTVANTHTYHVGARSVLVHNEGCGPAGVGDEASTARGAGGGAGADDVPEVVLDSSRYPESAAHARDSIGGDSVEYTIDRSGSKVRRAESMEGQPRIAGMDRDEWPPAMFEQGGAGSSVRGVTPSDNRGAGASIGNQCRGHSDGTIVRIVVC